MRPDKTTIDQFKKLDDLIGHNIENLVEDFERSSQDASGIPVAYQNAMFTSFVLGVLVPISPDSNFNRKFVHTQKSERRQVGP